ncbi:MAG TPA: HlyD family efflux transporter periplasmic adaptor subunit [Clostridiales bacterium]|nr:HlyD family efflux transporter periplasmic adaptor subunit [Clostridiales bacterium]
MKKYSKVLRRLIKVGIILAILVVAGVIGFKVWVVPRLSVKAGSEAVVTTANAEIRDIKNVLSSSGTIQPLASYDVTTLVSGEIIAADFEEGDIVQEGQVLYQIATDNLDSDIGNAETTVSRAKKEYTKAEKSYQEALDKYGEAQEDYKKAVAEYSDVNVLSTDTGIVTKVYVKAGDTIQAGSQLADVYDNSIMVLTVPFSSSEVNSSLVGRTAEVTIDEAFESIKGKVTKVSNIEKSLSGNRVVKEVTIEVANPGGITDSTTASASIGSIYSMDAGSFAVKTNTTITSDLSGEIAFLNIEEGDSISEGDVVLVISKDSVEDKLKSYLDAMDSAQDGIDNAKDSLESRQEAIEDAESSLQDIIDTRTDYSITSPVTGKVIKKNALKGDTVSSNNGGSSSLCTIYDLSCVTFDMYVDELDVMKVEEGQEVNITADALEGAEISGIVTNISLESTTSQGVTQYPVTVRIDDVGNLLPGMNVTGEIVIEKAEGVLAVPSDALQRGDMVYVKDSSVTEAQGDIPAGFKAVQVTTGITDGDYIEVQGGLSEGDEVYVKRTAASTNPNMMQFDIIGGRPSGGGGMPSGGSGRSGSGSGGRQTGGGFPAN